MKYVRTKDERIIEIPNKHQEIVYDGNVIISVEKIINGIRGETIVCGIVDKKANTIQELCDAFVYYDIYSKRYIILSNYREAYINYGTINETPFYGAIWTNKGLIYVAKMNEEGKLELL